MGVYKFRSLPRDTARCVGRNCPVKKTCMRHLQIDLDKRYLDENVWVVYMDGMYSDNDCEVRLGVEP